MPSVYRSYICSAAEKPGMSVLLLSGSYHSENEVNPSDDLDFRHHNYKEMRQVCAA